MTTDTEIFVARFQELRSRSIELKNAIELLENIKIEASHLYKKTAIANTFTSNEDDPANW